MIKLRPYQREARDAVLEEWKKGKSTLLAMSTGTGKTETFLSVLAAEHEAGRLDRALVIAHRRELILQPYERIRKHWKKQLPTPGVVMGEVNHQPDADLVIATVQTLSNEKRLARVLEAGAFSHVIHDECHHAVAKSHLELIEALKAARPDLRLLGVTATPKRTDQDGLSRVFDSVAYRVSIRDAITRHQALVPFTAIGVQLPVSFKFVREIGDGFDAEEAGSVLSAQNALEIIIETWQKHASSRPTIAFTASVAQAGALCRAFKAAGISAEWAYADTPLMKRRGILRRYQSGETRVLVNCQLWTEGVDLPATSCVLMARPTKSDLVYVQCVGRGLRLAPGKADCLILDFVPLDVRDMRMAGDLLGKPREQRKAEDKAKKNGVILECFAMNSDGDGIDADPDKVQLKVLDYFGASRLAWTFDGGVASVSIDKMQSLAVVLPDQARIEKANDLRARGLWKEAYDQLFEQVSSYQLFVVNGQRVDSLGRESDWEGASYLAQDYADQYGEGILADRNKKWRSQPASAGQLSFMSKLGIPIHPDISKGSAAQAITHQLVLNTLKRAGVIRESA